MATDTEQRYLALVAELARLEQHRDFTPIMLDLGPYSAFVMVGALQLAWRHPGHAERLRGLIEHIGRRIQESFPPEYADLLEAGWDTSRDVEVGK